MAEVQRLLLPASLPSIPGYDTAVAYRPLGRAGGDYYDFLALTGGRWGILIADVSGHGAAAALGTAVLHATVRACPCVGSPAALLGWVNRRLCGGYASGRGNFVTAFYVVLDPAAGLVTYASAGHPPPLVWSEARWRPLGRARRLPLGIVAGENFVERQAALKPGCTLVLYTDGFSEARNAEGAMFGGEGMAGVPRLPSDSAAATAGRIERAARAFRAGEPASDDQTLVILTANNGGHSHPEGMANVTRG